MRAIEFRGTRSIGMEENILKEGRTMTHLKNVDKDPEFKNFEENTLEIEIPKEGKVKDLNKS